MLAVLINGTWPSPCHSMIEGLNTVGSQTDLIPNSIDGTATPPVVPEECLTFFFILSSSFQGSCSRPL